MKQIYKTLIIIFIASFLYQCNSNDKKNTEAIKVEAKNLMDSTGIISYHLRDSDRVIRMRLSDMKTEKVDNAFSIKKDEYTTPTKKNGYLLSINFRVNNPYDEELVLPIPNYFSLTNGKDDFFTSKSLFSKSCYCNIIGSSEITNQEGEQLYSISDGECGGSRYCMAFKPKETKEFIIKFDQPILESQNELMLFGFDLYWSNPNRRGRTDVGLILDIEKGIIKGLKEF